MKVFAILLFTVFNLNSYSQIESILIKTYYPDKSTLFEEYLITKKDSTKNGSYKRYSTHGKIYVNGFYLNNNRIGTWEFYNKNTGYIELIEKYDYYLNKEIYYKDKNDYHAHFVGEEEEFENYFFSNKSLDTITNIEGVVVIQFTVDTTGNLKDFKINRELSSDVDELFVSILKDSPKWVPSMKNGVAQEEVLIIPIRIRKETVHNIITVGLPKNY